MCFGGNQQTGSQNNFGVQSQSSSTTYDPWVSQSGKNVFSNAATWLSDHPWQSYSGPMSASFGPQFGQASGYLSGQLGQTNPMTTQGGGALQSVIGAINPNASVSDYMNPYVGATLDPTIQNINLQAGQQRQQNDANATLSGAYGGSASGVENALLDKYTQQNIGNATSQAYGNAYNNAQTARLGNLNMLSSAGNSLAGVGQNAFTQGTTLASLLAGLGSQQQSAGQQGIQNALQQNQLNQTMPLQQFGSLAGILSGIPLNSNTNSFGINTGQQTQSQPNYSGYSMLGSLLGL